MFTCVSSHVRVIRLSLQFFSANSRLFVVFDSEFNPEWDPVCEPELIPEWIEPQLDLAALGRMVKVHWLPKVPFFWPSAIALNRLLVSVRFWETWSLFWSDCSEKSENKYTHCYFNHDLCHLIGGAYCQFLVIIYYQTYAGQKWPNFSQWKLNFE
jgi:hypothetical protein